jgi:hypothetical protein
MRPGSITGSPEIDIINAQVGYSRLAVASSFETPSCAQRALRRAPQDEEMGFLRRAAIGMMIIMQ